MLGVGSRVQAQRGLQALATLAALAQISTPSAAHFIKSHQLLVQKFAADRDRQKSSFNRAGLDVRLIFTVPREAQTVRGTKSGPQ